MQIKVLIKYLFCGVAFMRYLWRHHRKGPNHALNEIHFQLIVGTNKLYLLVKFPLIAIADLIPMRLEKIKV